MGRVPVVVESCRLRHFSKSSGRMAVDMLVASSNFQKEIELREINYK
jgi:hypothetical protein